MLTILTHLWDSYGEISDMEIEDNLTTMSIILSSSTQIKNVFDNLILHKKFLSKSKTTSPTKSTFVSA